MPTRRKKNGGPRVENGMQNGTVPETIKSEQVHKSGASVAVLSLLVVGVIIVSVAFRTTILDHGETFLTMSREFIEAKWAIFYDYFEGDFMKMGFALYVFAVVKYWIVGLLYLYVDLTGKPAFLYQFKIQQNVTKIPPEKLKKLLWNVTTHHLFYNIPTLFFAYHTLKWRGTQLKPSEIPSLPYFFMEVLVYYACVEAVFYYSHRIMHYPPLYKRIHKIHHEWTAPVALAAIYCHPIENFACNSLSVLAGPIVMGSHLLPTAIWLIAAQTVAMTGHSGYHMPFVRSPEPHDFHHLKFTNNFGPSGFLDWLHGTDTEFRKTKQFQRHKMLWTFTPMIKQIPDDPKPKY